MSDIVKVMRLQASRRVQSFVVPAVLLLGVSVLVIGIFAVLASTTSAGGDTARVGNTGVYQAVFWMLFASGVQVVATTYPIARALGASRRGYVLGSLAHVGVLSAYVTALLSVLYLIERATNYWGLGVRLVDIPVIADKGIAGLWVASFAVSVLGLVLGGVFGAAWLRFGTIGPWVASFILVLLGAVGIVLVVVNAPTVMPYVNLWSLAALMFVAAAALAASIMALMRGVSVRGM